MSDTPPLQTIKDHWEREDLGEAILAALTVSGGDLDALTLDDLAPFDQFHGGLGGPARTLAVEFGCHVTVVDLTESYIAAGKMLTSLMKLEDRITFQVGDALALPFEDESFDVVWTQNSGMNIADKERLYAGFHRLLPPNGLLAIQEPMSGPNPPPHFPVMWSRDGANHFLRKPEQMRATIEAAGLQTLQWDDVSDERPPNAPRPTHSIQSLVMGDDLLAEIMRAGQRNDAEKRLVMVQAVFKRL